MRPSEKSQKAKLPQTQRHTSRSATVRGLKGITSAGKATTTKPPTRKIYRDPKTDDVSTRLDEGWPRAHGRDHAGASFADTPQIMAAGHIIEHRQDSDSAGCARGRIAASIVARESDDVRTRWIG
jgi:hypothetical protein